METITFVTYTFEIMCFIALLLMGILALIRRNHELVAAYFGGAIMVALPLLIGWYVWLTIWVGFTS